MAVIDEDIINYREYNSLADTIASINRAKEGIKSNEYKRLAKLNDDIAQKESRMELIAGLLSARLGPEWASRCVEMITRKPGHVSVLVGTSEFCDAVRHVGVEDVETVRLVVGSECFEIRRVERGMDGGSEG